MTNRNNVPLPPAAVAVALKAIADARAALAPYLIALTPKEREEIPKMGDKTLAFVTKAAELASANPALFPGYVDVAGLQLDADTSAELLPVYSALAGLTLDVESTRMLAGSEGYVGALQVYGGFQGAAAAGQPAAQSAVAQLSPRFKRSGGGGDKPSP